MSQERQPLKFSLLVLYGALLLLIPAFFNGYPLLNSDDGTYIPSGFLPETPIDRPITYGLLINAFSFHGLSLWIFIFLQALCVSWLLQLLILRLLAAQHTWWKSLIIVSVLACCTPLSWISSELLPDVFTPITLMALALLLIGKEHRVVNIFLWILFTVGVATHISHVMMFIGLAVVIFLFRKLFFKQAQLKTIHRKLIVSVLLALATIATMGSAISKSKHVFFMSAMLEQGILKPYLDEHCATEHYAICAFKDSLPVDGNAFLWDPKSPVYRTGGWKANKTEYNKIISGSFTEPKFISRHIIKSLEFTARQTMEIQVGDGNVPLGKETPTDESIQQFIPGDISLLRNARQQRNELLSKIELPNAFFYIIALTSVLILAICGLRFRKTWSAPLSFFVFLVLVLIIINNWNCATFSMVNGRYGCRVTWLVTFCSLLLLMNRGSNESSQRLKFNNK